MNETSQLLQKIMAKVGIVTWVRSAPMLHHGSAEGLCGQIPYGKKKKKSLRLSSIQRLAILPAMSIKLNKDFLFFFLLASLFCSHGYPLH